MEYTGVVVAVADLSVATAFWRDVMGFEATTHAADPSNECSLRQPSTGQVVTLVEISEPDPAMALAIRTSSIAETGVHLTGAGYRHLWSDASAASGTRFAAYRDAAGVALLLYQPPDAV